MMPPTNHMFWQQEIETLDRPALDALQLKRLRETVRRLERVPFYRGKFLETGFKPEEIHSAADLRRLPFTTARGFAGELPGWIAGGFERSRC